MPKMSKAAAAAAIAADRRDHHDPAALVRKYTLAELLTLVEAFSHDDLYCPDARRLFDAVSWSQFVRSNRGADQPGVLKEALTAVKPEPAAETPDARQFRIAKAEQDARDVTLAANYEAAHPPKPAAASLPTLPTADQVRNVSAAEAVAMIVPAAEPAAAEPAIKVYLVVVQTALGLMDVELIGTSGEIAARRAKWSLIHKRTYGDIDEIEWVSVEESGCRYAASCDNGAVRFISLPETFGPDGERNDTRIPVCQKCYDFCVRQGMQQG